MSTLAVLLPTRNAIKLLPGHLESMEPWLDLAEEIVVVDSESRDGTREFLKRRLPQARLLQNPPGLYQSWNFGIQQINAPWTYISTIGDGITREGLIHLCELMERHAADVVISPPDFVDATGRPVRNNAWPVHDINAAMGLSHDVCFEGLPLFLLALAYIPFALLGSSASNLYRTATLQRFPFPTEYGRNGDGAWGLMNALQIRLAITPRRMSFFRRHRRTYKPGEYAVPDGGQRMLDTALGMLEARLQTDAGLRQQSGRLGVDRFVQAKRKVQAWRMILQEHRRRRLPWILNPQAWRARRKREVAQRQCLELVHELLVTHGPAPAQALPVIRQPV